MLMFSCNMRPEYYVVLILFMMSMKAAQAYYVDGNRKTNSQINRLPTSSYTNNQLYTDLLQLHNEYRSKHGVEPLTLNKTLCCNAQKWAKKLANENLFMHQTNSPYGENLYVMWSSKPTVVTAEDAFFSWYNEGKDYNYSSEPKNNNAGHFTQVVWKGTQELGLGMATKSGRTVIVATYYPPGNYIGEYTKNVMQPK